MFMRLARYLPATPIVAVGMALLLLVASLALAFHNEQVSQSERAREIQVQAEILAGSIAAPLAFDDRQAAQEYVNALRANPAIEAVGTYGADGSLAASFGRKGAAPPQFNSIGPPVIHGNQLIVTAPVVQGGAYLGSVYLRTMTEPLPHRAVRYLGIAIIVIMACLLVGTLGASYATVSAANQRLQAEIESREQAEEALRQAQKMEAMGQLTGGVAHDFNNLLMVASSGLDLLDRTTDPAKIARLRQGIRQAIDRGANLTQQLLTFARRSPLNPDVLELEPRVRGLQDLLDRSLRENIKVELDFPPSLWLVEVDPSQLEVAVLNIALNARDAMPAGGRIVITAHNEPAPQGAETSGDMVRLSIHDTGTGIPAELMDKVFEPFFTTKGVGQGTGLGLSQVYGFARSSGGNVKIESEVGSGTTVSLLLPRSSKSLPVKAKPDTLDAGEAGKRFRILLVEDDEHVAQLVGEMLDQIGYASHRAPAAARAISMLEADSSYDLLLSDMIMPGGMTGLDLARDVARRWPEIPTLLMTGYSDGAAAAADEGITVLNKPYTIEALTIALQTALHDRRPNAE